MKKIRYFILLGMLLSVAAVAQSNRMPQDDWFFDNEVINQPAKGLHIDKQGNYYLGQTTKVKILNAQMQPVREIAGFTDIRGMCTNDAGDLFVFDWGSKMIRRYNNQGGLVSSFGGSTYFATTTLYDVYRQMLTINASGEVCALSPAGYKVNVFTQDGVFLRSFGEQGSAASQFGSIPYSITSMSDGRHAVSSSEAGKLYAGYLSIFDKNGVWVDKFTVGTNTPHQDAQVNINSTVEGLIISQDTNTNGYYKQINPFVRVSLGNRSLYYFLPGLDNPMYPSYNPWSYYTFGIASRPNGDIVASTGSELRVWKRRYQGSHVAMAPKSLPLPSVLKVAQRTGTAILDVDFKVDDADSPLIEVALLAYKNGESKPSKLILPTSFVDGTQSSIGPSVQANQVHRVSWNVGADWDVETGSVSVEVLAKDDRLLKAQKFAFAPGAAPSASNIQDPDPHGTWLWLLAKRDPAVKFENGNIVGVAAAVSGEILATSSTTYEEDWDGDGIVDNVGTYEFEAFQSTPAGTSYLRGLYAQELGL